MTEAASQSAQSRKQIALLALGILFTMLPVTMLVPVLKELVSIRFTVSNFWAHAFMSTSLIGAILFAPFAGRLIDRSARRGLIIGIALFLNGLCFLGMAVAPNFAVLMIVRFLEGAMHITALSAWMATGADMSRGGDSGKVMGALGGMIIFGITIGVPLGGVIAGDTPNNVFVAAALASIFAILFVFGLSQVNVGNNAYSQFSSLTRAIKQNRWLLIPYAYTFIDRLSIGVVVSTLSLYMSDILKLTPAQRGAELSYFLVPFALLCYPIGKLSDRYGRIWMMAIGSLLFGFVFMWYGYVEGWQLSMVMLVSGILSALMFTPTMAISKDLSTPEQHGTVFAGYNIAGSLGFIVGPLLGGTLFTWLLQSQQELQAYQSTFVLTGLFEIACAVISLPFLLRAMNTGVLR